MLNNAIENRLSDVRQELKQKQSELEELQIEVQVLSRVAQELDLINQRMYPDGVQLDAYAKDLWAAGYGNQKIEAIKKLREKFKGLGLLEAKQCIERNGW